MTNISTEALRAKWIAPQNLIEAQKILNQPYTLDSYNSANRTKYNGSQFSFLQKLLLSHVIRPDGTTVQPYQLLNTRGLTNTAINAATLKNFRLADLQLLLFNGIKVNLVVAELERRQWKRRALIGAAGVGAVGLGAAGLGYLLRSRRKVKAPRKQHKKKHSKRTG